MHLLVRAGWRRNSRLALQYRYCDPWACRSGTAELAYEDHLARDQENDDVAPVTDHAVTLGPDACYSKLSLNPPGSSSISYAGKAPCSMRFLGRATACIPACPTQPRFAATNGAPTSWSPSLRASLRKSPRPEHHSHHPGGECRTTWPAEPGRSPVVLAVVGLGRGLGEKWGSVGRGESGESAPNRPGGLRSSLRDREA